MIYSFIDKPTTERTLLQIIEKSSFKNIPYEMKGKGKFLDRQRLGSGKRTLTMMNNM